MAPLWNQASDERPFKYEPINQSEDMMTLNRLGLIVVGVVFTLIGAVTMSLRTLTVLKKRRTAGLDDLIILTAWLFSIGFTIASYLSVRWGVGLLEKNAPLGWQIEAIKMVFLVEIFYWPTMYFIKLSALFLYLRLAKRTAGALRPLTLCTIALITLQFLSTIVVTGVQCIPAQRYWNPTIHGHCINISAFFYSTNAFTIVSDIIIIALPIPTVWKIQQTRRQRFLLLAAFLAAGISTVASCVRVYSVHIYTSSRFEEIMRDAAPINLWSFIEINLGILGASAPALKVLFHRQKTSKSKSKMVNLGLGISKPPAERLEEVKDSECHQRGRPRLRACDVSSGLTDSDSERQGGGAGDDEQLCNRGGGSSELTLVELMPHREEKL